MFSRRTKWNFFPNSLSSLAVKKRSKGEYITDLTVSNPTLCNFKYPVQEIASALAGGSTPDYRPHPRGLSEARSAIAGYYSGEGITAEPERIIVTAGTSEAYSFLFKLLCNPGEEIIVPTPSYPLLDYICRLNDVRMQRYRLVYDGEWRIDIPSLRNAVSKRTRGIVLIHPNNPTGSYVKQREFEEICIFTAERGIAVIADEVFKPYEIFTGNNRASIAGKAVPGLVFSLDGISKLLGLPHLKLSWISVRGNMALVNDAINRLEMISDTYLSVNTPVQAAASELFRSCASVRDQINERIKANCEIANSVLSGSCISVFRSEGGWSLILQLPHIHSDEEWSLKLLSEKNILVYPGHFFDMEHASCIVSSLLPPNEIFETALLNIRNVTDEK